ncbi:nucleotidyltransferase family protein [Rubinisphaera margarita]|uniref:nucleotidyltransferase family protein n=1 Tax=Rubinisphaera margarita TaxID=2909586 RepID=UPI001EE9588C|nr:nucleotidyltransferase family protein [Rubinisphaera margarita]MCG6156486.1 nucleotidyltransferase family protein [Rubinisphaera margarita]
MNAAIVLAAGGSTRMGQPKQLLDWNGRPLLRHTINELISAGLDHVIVVLGAQADVIESQALADAPAMVEIVYNPDWETGQASSLSTGMRAANARGEEVRLLLVALCDQPFVIASDYRKLIDALSADGASAAATRYDSGAGVPAAFTRQACLELLHVQGDVGARGWLRAQPFERVALVDIPTALRDLDSPRQYQHALADLSQTSNERNR